MNLKGKKKGKIHLNYWVWAFWFGLVLYWVNENESKSQQVYSFVLSPLQLYQSHTSQDLNQSEATHCFLGINHYQASYAWLSPKHWAPACTNIHVNRTSISEKRKKHVILKCLQNTSNCNRLGIIQFCHSICSAVLKKFSYQVWVWLSPYPSLPSFLSLHFYAWENFNAWI